MNVRNIMLTTLVVMTVQGCSTVFRSPSLSEIRYVPGQTPAEELVEQAGLPSRVESVERGNETFQRFVYVRGSDKVQLFVPIALPVGNNTYLGALVKEEYSTYRPTPDVALACLVSEEQIVVTCLAGEE